MAALSTEAARAERARERGGAPVFHRVLGDIDHVTVMHPGELYKTVRICGLCRDAYAAMDNQRASIVKGEMARAAARTRRLRARWQEERDAETPEHRAARQERAHGYLVAMQGGMVYSSGC